MSLTRKDKTPAGPTKLGTPVTEVAVRDALPVRFDPRWLPCQPCVKAQCAPAHPCQCPCHGGWKLARALHLIPPHEWNRRLRTATCILCECVGGVVPPEKVGEVGGCPCHAPDSEAAA
jgi:hypothetical protein